MITFPMQQQDKMEAGLGSNLNFFAEEFNEPLVHQTVIAFQSNAKPICNAQKSRGDVNHSTRKIRAQKGSGMARVGMTSSPTRRGGGRAFPNLGHGGRGARVNKKMFRGSLKSIISELLRINKLIVMEKWQLPSYKTKDLVHAIGLTTESPSTLMIVEDTEMNRKLYLSSRNLENLSVLSHSEINPRTLLLFDKIFISAKALLKVRNLIYKNAPEETDG